MFTGIIKKISTIKKISQNNGSFFVVIHTPRGWLLERGESILINGICTTVQKIGKTDFEIEWMPETIKKTIVSHFIKGMTINLERALSASDRFGGHFLLGHVDAVGEALFIKNEGESRMIKFSAPSNIIKYIVPKGAIALDGVSLTVVDVKKNWFSVALMNYTLKNTNFDTIKIGSKVNIETDIFARYVEKIIKKKNYAKKNKKK